MVGRDVASEETPRAAVARNEVALRVRDVVIDANVAPPATAVSLEVRGGELVGVAGVEGNGQIELVEALYGMRFCTGGSIDLAGCDVTHVPTIERRRQGLRYIAADRQREGLVLDFDVAENMLLGDQRLGHSALLVDLASARERADEVAKSFRVARYDRRAAMRDYSGGTQQKFLVGREANARARALIAFAPTRGVDIGAARAIHRRLRDLQTQGVGILLVSYDLDEIRALANRILVMSKGRIVGELAVEGADDATLGRLMGGSAA